MAGKVSEEKKLAKALIQLDQRIESLSEQLDKLKKRREYLGKKKNTKQVILEQLKREIADYRYRILCCEESMEKYNGNGNGN